jgi:RNA 2',3'-cyclic 3'-phosphodiesterase
MTPTAIRAFIAIELPQLIQEKLGQAIVRLQEGSPRAVRWVAARNIHLTLKFLGNVSQDNLTQLTRVIQNEAQRYKPFEIRAGGLGAYPNKFHPRVIWVGIDAPPSLTEIQRGIDRETERLGYQCEDRDFSAHLTLGRVSQHAGPQEVKQIAELLAQTTIGDLGTVQVKSLRLFRSDLQPGGAVYTPLFDAQLGK